jgi:hypothetical protein
MAERRMMSKKIIHSDAFLDLPATTQNLYFHLMLEGDDEGFVNSPKRIQRTIGATDGDAQMLIAKKFIISFESGVIVIKHWRIHNYIQNDRFKESSHLEERSKLVIKDNNAYTLDDVSKMYPECTPSIGEVRLGKDSLVEDSIGESTRPQQKRFIPPTLEEVQTRISEMNYLTDAERFMNYYESNGWMVGRTKMKDWKAALANWSKDKRGGSQNGYQPKQSKLDTSMETYYSLHPEERPRLNFIEGEIV